MHEMHDITRIMEHINAGKVKSGKPMWAKEQAIVSQWIELYDSIDELPTLVDHLERVNDWYCAKYDKLPESPHIYHKSTLRKYFKLKEQHDNA